MRKTLVVGAVAVGLMAPAVADAKKPEKAQDDKPNAAQECRAERTALGVDAFREKYGTNKNKRNAFGKCVSAKRKQQES